MTASSTAGPALVLAPSDSGFDPSIAATALAVFLAATGWLAGVFMTQHPVLLELRRTAEAWDQLGSSWLFVLLNLADQVLEARRERPGLNSVQEGDALRVRVAQGQAQHRGAAETKVVFGVHSIQQSRQAGAAISRRRPVRRAG